MDRPLRHLIGSIDRLVVFDAVVRTGSFTKAASVLGVSQPAISRQIALLEDDLHAALFLRENNQVALTEVASKLAQRVDAGLTEFEAGLSAIRGAVDTLTLAVPPAIAESWFSPRLAELRAALEPAIVRLVIYDRESDLRSVGHDLSIRFGDRFGSHERSEMLIEEAVTPVTSPDYADQWRLTQTTEPSLLLEGPRLLHIDPTNRRWLNWSEWFEAAGTKVGALDPEIAHPNYGILLQQALASQGVTLGWETLLGDLLTRGLLVQVGPTMRRPDYGYHLVWPPGLTRNPTRRKLRDWLAHVLQTEITSDTT